MQLTPVILTFCSVVLLLACVVILIRSKLMLLYKGYPVGWSFATTQDYANLVKASQVELNPIEKKQLSIQKTLVLSLRWMCIAALALLALAVGFYLL